MASEVYWAAASAIIVGSLVYAAVRRALVSLTTTVAILVLFILTVAFRESYVALALIVPPVVSGAGPPPLTLFTAMYVHANLFHVAFNVLGLVLIGPLVEEKTRSFRFAILYFVTGVLATLGYYVVHLGDPIVAVVGASGAISGVFGALGRLMPRQRLSLWIPFPLPPLPAEVLVPGYVAVSALLGALGFFGSFLGLRIAWEAHVVGAIAGYLLAPLIMRVPTPRRRVVRFETKGLSAVAKTVELQDILSTMEKETVPEVRAAWLDRFFERARCPQCGGPLRLRGSKATSPCGWKLRFDLTRR